MDYRHKPSQGVKIGREKGVGIGSDLTPKHGSWLNMAESELSVLSGQCLDRRIPDKRTLTEEVGAWEHAPNKKHVKADWQLPPPTPA